MPSIPLTLLLVLLATGSQGCTLTHDTDDLRAWDGGARDGGAQDGSPSDGEPNDVGDVDNTDSGRAECGIDEYLTAAGCRPWTSCLAGSHVLRNGSATSDRECQGCTSGTYSDHDNAPICTPWRVCAAGEYESAAATFMADRQCQGCEPGTFNDEEGASACSTWSDCAPGTFVQLTGTSTSDRQCSPCPGGTNSSRSNQATCVADGDCVAGSYGGPDRCTRCTPGFYCPGGITVPVACVAGTFDHDAEAATPCVATTVCAPGSFVATAGTATTDQTCTGCAAGHYSTTPNAAECQPWTTCTSPETEWVPGTATLDHVCANTIILGQTCNAFFVEEVRTLGTSGQLYTFEVVPPRVLLYHYPRADGDEDLGQQAFPSGRFGVGMGGSDCDSSFELRWNDHLRITISHDASGCELASFASCTLDNKVWRAE